MSTIFRVQLFPGILHPATATFSSCSCTSKRYLDTPESFRKITHFESLVTFETRLHVSCKWDFARFLHATMNFISATQCLISRGLGRGCIRPLGSDQRNNLTCGFRQLIKIIYVTGTDRFKGRNPYVEVETQWANEYKWEAGGVKIVQW
jgi:hypothetical protein